MVVKKNHFWKNEINDREMASGSINSKSCVMSTEWEYSPPLLSPRLHVVCKVMQDSPYSLRWFKDLSWANLSCLETACGHKPLKRKWHWRTEWMSKQILPGDRCCTRILHSRWWPTVFPHSQPPQHFSSNRFFFCLLEVKKVKFCQLM